MEWRTSTLCVLVLALSWGLQVDGLMVRRSNHVDNICSLWGNFHFKTFDGDIYQFQGVCEYDLVSECHVPVPRFSVHVKRAQLPGNPHITRVLVTIGDLAIEITKKLVMVNSDVVKLPHYTAGVLLEQNAIYTKLYAKLGLSVMWNREDAIMVELDTKYTNHTCGLCGDFNNIPIYDEFLNRGRVMGPTEFGNQHRVHIPNDYCEDPYEEDETDQTTEDKCQVFRTECSEMLEGEAWSSCTSLLNTEPYIQACIVDKCWRPPGDIDDTIPLCTTLSEYSRQCSHAGGTPPNWRKQDFCAVKCPFNMVYSENGSPCVDTCTHTDTSSLCEEHKMDGCFCPTGTVFDDISEKGCIPQEECQCKHDEIYNPGDMLLMDDKECLCQQGKWICEALPTPGVCALEEGSHFTTYDGKEFTFHGDCYYVLSKDCVESKFLLLGQLAPCVTQQTDTCLKSIALILNNDKNNPLVIKDDGLVRHNGELTLPYTTADLTVFRPSSFHLMLQTSFGLQIQVQLVPLMQLYITLNQSFQSKTCGLCGNFNMVLSDELKTPQGLVEGTAASFGNFWKAQYNCPDYSERLDDPCSYSIDSESYAEHWCSKLKEKNSLFAKCHSAVNPESYYKRCKYSSCTCEKSENCLCAVFSSYVRACTVKGIFLQGWRDTVCEKYTEHCPASHNYSYLLQSCQRTCDSLSSERQGCSTDYVPVDGCACPDGLYENEKGVCVPMDKCSCYYNGEHIKPGKSVNIKNEHCVCTNGKLHCRSWKTLITDCSAPKVFFNCSEAGPHEHGLECAQTCMHKAIDCYPAGCKSGCQCPSGLLDDGRGYCVKEHDCPCQHNGHFYAAGSKITDQCNTCTCKQGKWDCTEEKCPGTCTIYGSGHYNTFDKQTFGFSGECGYVAVQNKCGNKTGTFHVITENVPCGTTGTTCSKSVRIVLGKTQLDLIDGSITKTELETGPLIVYRVRNVGLYVVIESDIGLTVFWDRKTTVRIILQPQHKGEVCGLCGNYNGNGKDDFTTQSQLQVSDVLEFVNSWKVNSLCPGATPDFDPCSERTDRQTWAKMQCSIITGETFKDCHKMVDPSPYFENCVRDSCACDSGGDCECFCTAVAAYAQACNEAEVCVAWRTPEICPVFCDYYNDPDECLWHYSPCHTPCYKTCLNPEGNCSNPLPNLEGCYPTCPKDKPIFDEKNQICVEECDICFINGTVYNPGDEIPSDKPCTSCICQNGKASCSKREGCCFYNGTEYGENDVIYDVTDNMGMCYYAICINSTIIKFSEPCTTTTQITTTEVTFSSTTEHKSTPHPPHPDTTTPFMEPSTSTSYTVVSTTELTTTTATTTISTTESVPTSTVPTETPCVICEWSEWFNVYDPQPEGSDLETYKNIKDAGNTICETPENIECRAVMDPDMPFDEFLQQTQQIAQCNVSFGLTCKKDDQVHRPYKCFDYEIRVYCCRMCNTTPSTTNPSTTTTMVSPTTTQIATESTESTQQTTVKTTKATTTPVLTPESTTQQTSQETTVVTTKPSSTLPVSIPITSTSPSMTTTMVPSTTTQIVTESTKTTQPTTEKITKATTTPVFIPESTTQQTSQETTVVTTKQSTTSPVSSPVTSTSPSMTTTMVPSTTTQIVTESTKTTQPTPEKTTKATTTPVFTSKSTTQKTSQETTVETSKPSTTSPVSSPITSTSPSMTTTMVPSTTTQIVTESTKTTQPTPEKTTKATTTPVFIPESTTQQTSQETTVVTTKPYTTSPVSSPVTSTSPSMTTTMVPSTTMQIVTESTKTTQPTPEKTTKATTTSVFTPKSTTQQTSQETTVETSKPSTTSPVSSPITSTSPSITTTMVPSTTTQIVSESTETTQPTPEKTTKATTTPVFTPKSTTQKTSKETTLVTSKPSTTSPVSSPVTSTSPTTLTTMVPSTTTQIVSESTETTQPTPEKTTKATTTPVFIPESTTQQTSQETTVVTTKQSTTSPVSSPVTSTSPSMTTTMVPSTTTQIVTESTKTTQPTPEKTTKATTTPVFTPKSTTQKTSQETTVETSKPSTTSPVSSPVTSTSPSITTTMVPSTTTQIVTESTKTTQPTPEKTTKATTTPVFIPESTTQQTSQETTFETSKPSTTSPVSSPVTSTSPSITTTMVPSTTMQIVTESTKTTQPTPEKTTKATTTPVFTTKSTTQQTSQETTVVTTKQSTTSPVSSPITSTSPTTLTTMVPSTTTQIVSESTETTQQTPEKTTKATTTPVFIPESTTQQTSQETTVVTTKQSTTSPVSSPVTSTSPSMTTTMVPSTTTQIVTESTKTTQPTPEKTTKATTTPVFTPKSTTQKTSQETTVETSKPSTTSPVSSPVTSTSPSITTTMVPSTTTQIVTESTKTTQPTPEKTTKATTTPVFIPESTTQQTSQETTVETSKPSTTSPVSSPVTSTSPSITTTMVPSTTMQIVTESTKTTQPTPEKTTKATTTPVFTTKSTTQQTSQETTVVTTKQSTTSPVSSPITSTSPSISTTVVPPTTTLTTPESTKTTTKTTMAISTTTREIPSTPGSSSPSPTPTTITTLGPTTTTERNITVVTGGTLTPGPQVLNTTISSTMTSISTSNITPTSVFSTSQATTGTVLVSTIPTESSTTKITEQTSTKATTKVKSTTQQTSQETTLVTSKPSTTSHVSSPVTSTSPSTFTSMVPPTTSQIVTESTETTQLTTQQTSQETTVVSTKPSTTSPVSSPVTSTSPSMTTTMVPSTTTQIVSESTETTQPTPEKTTKATSTPVFTPESTTQQTSQESTVETSKPSTTSPVSSPITSTSPSTATSMVPATTTQIVTESTETTQLTTEKTTKATTSVGPTPSRASTTPRTSTGKTTLFTPTSTVVTTTTSVPSTTMCFCVLNGKQYKPGQTILNITDIGSGICLTIICSNICEIKNDTMPCPTTPQPTTTVPSTTPKYDCPEWDVNKNNTFEICNCTMARCIEDNIIEIIPYECPPPQDITCTNGKKPVLVPTENHCCQEYACDCFCEGWGDPHYITFDGHFYSHQGNCTYVLMEEIKPKHRLKIYIDNVKCDPREFVSCPRALIVSYNNQVITLKNNNLIGAARLEALMGHTVLNLPFVRNGVRVLGSGVNMILEIPQLQVVLTFGVTGFSVFLPFKHFGKNTQGHCGTCNNNQADDCMLPGGKLLNDCAVMADYWPAKDLYNPDCPVPPLVPPTSAPTNTPTKKPCPPNPVCELLNNNVFKECHPFVSPDNYFKGCQFDSCHMTNPAVVCTSLQTYALACSQFGICLDWRRHSDLCTFECEGDKVYKPCGPAEPPTCEDRSNEYTLNMTTEGCFCPDGTLLFNKDSGVCVDKCGCLDPSGQAREFGEKFQYGCQDCVCDESTASVICKPRQCSSNNQITCTEPGFIVVNETDPSDECCTILTCRCDSSFCPPVEGKCNIGYAPVLNVPEGKCCPELTCEPKKVCVHRNIEYEPGTSVPVVDCQECQCTWDVDPNTQLYKIKCGLVTCDKKCEPGFEYVEPVGDECCGKCVQTKCILNLNGTKSLLKTGAAWTPTSQACDRFTCLYIGGEYITTNYKIHCPPFNIDNCQPGTVQLSADGCCQVCVEKDKGCKIKTISDYIIHNNCQSENKVEQAHCEGECNSYSKYSEMGSSLCSCCQATRTSDRTVTLKCLNGDAVSHSYKHVEECGCNETKCPKISL